MTFAKNLPAFFMTDFQSSNEVLLVQKNWGLRNFRQNNGGPLHIFAFYTKDDFLCLSLSLQQGYQYESFYLSHSILK